jgi:AraC family transcriptional regulator, regulatory protein of adaptative response / methylated-DNA-[protein]-cysteine methyltransferase
MRVRIDRRNDVCANRRRAASRPSRGGVTLMQTAEVTRSPRATVTPPADVVAKPAALRTRDAQAPALSPAARHRGDVDTRIRFAAADSTLGSILIAATDRGICAILLGDGPDALARDLRNRFPQAHLSGGDEAVERWVSEVIDYVEAPDGGLGLPLAIGGTAFQQQVWAAVRAVPLGTTATYADIARAIGEPAAVRAVARACGANPAAVAIPCHRVVRSDGSLSGYRWGIARKRDLLIREGIAR